MFLVIYRWRIVAGRDAQFRVAWRRLTDDIFAVRGSYGSRLAQTDDGSYVGIAAWPSREAWAATDPPLPNEEQMMASLRESIASSEPPETMTSLDGFWRIP